MSPLLRCLVAGMLRSDGGVFDVEDRTIEVVVSHSLRSSEMGLGLAVTITKGFGAGKSGYIASNGADCKPLNLPSGIDSLDFYESDGSGGFRNVYL